MSEHESPVIQTKSDPARTGFTDVLRALQASVDSVDAVDQPSATTPGGATAHTTGLFTGEGGG